MNAVPMPVRARLARLRALSLVELLVVLVILAVLAALVVVAGQLSTSARQRSLDESLRSARQAAEATAATQRQDPTAE